MCSCQTCRMRPGRLATVARLKKQRREDKASRNAPLCHIFQLSIESGQNLTPGGENVGRQGRQGRQGLSEALQNLRCHDCQEGRRRKVARALHSSRPRCKPCQPCQPCLSALSALTDCGEMCVAVAESHESLFGNFEACGELWASCGQAVVSCGQAVGKLW
jgi:hypothetical protein